MTCILGGNFDGKGKGQRYINNVVYVIERGQK